MLESPLECKEIKPVNPNGNQSWIFMKHHEQLMLKLKLQYFGHLMGRADLLEKTLMLGKIEGMKRRGRQRIRWLDGITDSMDMSLIRAVCSSDAEIGPKSDAWPHQSQGDIRRCRHMYFLARFETEMIQILRIFLRIELTQRLDQNSFSLLFG